MSAKKTRSNKKQLNVLVNFMSTHNHLATGEFTGPLGAKRAESEWQILRDILKKYGPDRTVEQWKQTWKDLKNGAATVPTVSEMGTKVLNIIGHESSTGIGPEESSISQANEIIEVSVVEHDTQSKLFERTTAPSSFADELENIPLAPSNSHLAPSTSHSAPSHSTRYATAQNKKERSHDVFNRLQQENNACLQVVAVLERKWWQACCTPCLIYAGN